MFALFSRHRVRGDPVNISEQPKATTGLVRGDGAEPPDSAATKLRGTMPDSRGFLCPLGGESLSLFSGVCRDVVLPQQSEVKSCVGLSQRLPHASYLTGRVVSASCKLGV